MRTHITPAGRTPAEAARKRRKHERVIAEQDTPQGRLRRAWSWVLAELKHNPDGVDDAITAITDLARDLNGRSTR
jgi:hypothetical protein